MSLEKKQEIFELFSQAITPERKRKIETYAAARTEHVCVVLEDIYQAHNTSAALRSCECFGVQNIYVIEQNYSYALHESVAKGAGAWLDIKRYGKRERNNTQACFEDLKAAGYSIAATTPHEKDMLISQLPLEKPVALDFGTEQTGLSDYALAHADYFVKIPMYGFTESFNISVSVAVCLYDITQRLRASTIPWQLSPEEILDLKLHWLGLTTSRAKEIKALLERV